MIVVIFSVLIALSSISRSVWSGVLLYNGDSLVLPLLQQSILRGDSLHFVSSSQLFLFPEAPLFLISSVIGVTVRGSLIVNAVLNVVAMYAMFRIIAHFLAHRSRHRFLEITIALIATVLFVIFVLLEPNARVNFSGLATPLLTTTYYYGVILSGLATVALTLWVSRTFGNTGVTVRRVGVYAIITVILATLTTFSNPLFIFQVFAPLFGALAILLFCGRISWKRFVVLAGFNAVGIVIGMVLRQVFGWLFPITLKSYLSLKGIPLSVDQLRATIAELSHSSSGTLKLLLVAGLIVLTIAILVYALYAQARPRLASRITHEDLFIVGFVSISSVSLPIGMIATGSATTRYLEPMMVFPLLTGLAIGVYVLRRMLLEVKSTDLRRNLSRFSVGIVGLFSVLLIVVGAVNIPPVIRMADGVGYSGARCFDNFIRDSRANGVGSFWSTRPLELYGSEKGEVLQVDSNLQPFQWMINVGAYKNKSFSYVVVDGTLGITPKVLQKTLGSPARVVGCDGFSIYDYRGTAGATKLTSIIRTTVASILSQS